MKNLNGTRALVTGAGSGIGRELSLALAREGVDLWLLDINPTSLAEVREEVEKLSRTNNDQPIEVQTSVCDVSKPTEITAAVQSLLAKWGRLNILVNNAGVAYYGPTEKMTAEQWNWLMSINLLAPIQFTRELLPTLLAQTESHLLNICSISGLVAGGRFAAYHTSKFGLVGFTEAMRAEFSRQGLGVTALCPGPVRTNLYRSALNGRPDRAVPHPPEWICVPVEKVAVRGIRAIQKNQRFVLIGFVAHVLFRAKKYVPGVLDLMNRASRKKRKQFDSIAASDRVNKAA
jgi:short-subunit dehydrogenase